MVHDYNWKPKPIVLLSKDEEARYKLCDKAVREWIASGQRLKGVGRGASVAPMAIGMELEVELVKDVKGRLAEEESDRFEQAAGQLLFYFKRDSSLRNGFEIVSHPRTIKSWNEVKNKLKDMMKELRDGGFRSYDTGRCGMHFHINRSHFSGPNHIAKFLRFWEENPEMSFALSRRSVSSMEKYSHLHENPSLSMGAILYNHKYNVGGRSGVFDAVGAIKANMPHHSAVALTANTVEVRIFRGTMNVNTILATMDMVEKIVSITRNCSHTGLKVCEVVKWIPENKKNKRVLKLLAMSKKVDKAQISVEDKDYNRYRKEAHSSGTKKAIAAGCARVIDHWILLANNREVDRIKKKGGARDEYMHLNLEEMKNMLGTGVALATPGGRLPRTAMEIEDYHRYNMNIGISREICDMVRRWHEIRLMAIPTIITDHIPATFQLPVTTEFTLAMDPEEDN